MTKLKLPKILVLGNSLPGSRDGGGVVRDEVLKRYPKDRYVCAAIEHSEGWRTEDGVPGSVEGIPCILCPLVPRLSLRGARFYMPLLRFIGFRLVAPWRIRQIVKFGKRHRVDLVWAELQYDALLIAQKVAEGLGVPFVGTIWDDPEGWLRDLGYHRSYHKLIQVRFRDALKAARYLSTAGEAMQKAYEQEYGVKSVILRHGFEKPVLSSKGRKQNDDIVIGFVGSLYGRDAWEAFLSAIARMNESGRFPQIKIRIFGSSNFPYDQNGVQIEQKGWQPAELMLQEIAETDFCYLPYWFEPKKRRHVELSFPNKFETYIATGRPIFYHGPDYAGIVETIKQYGVGLCVHSLELQEIGLALKKMIKDYSLRESFSQAAINAFHKEFNANIMIRNYAELIGADSRIFSAEITR
jgi:glycosyltransferase involved in cell wall biosynthesis